MIPQVRSIYRWDGKVQDDSEALGLIKTVQGNFEPLRDRLRELHPYDVPELIAIQVADGLPEYLAWLVDSTRDPS